MITNSILQKADKACSGCGACVAICPAGAIRLQLDGAGFYTAVVDAEKCVDCGLCRKVCGRYGETAEGVSLYDAALYALQSADPGTVKCCSSGGIAQELTAWALNRGWKAVGVVYNTETDRAEHRIARNAGDAQAFVGSKYLQSDPSAAFREALEDARKHPETNYILTGTPCQIAGMAKAARQANVRQQFLLVEIFCHGVPSYRVWEAECQRLRGRLGAARFEEVQFRYKKDDWHSYCLRVDDGGKTVFAQRETTLFWQVFFENILLGDACYDCQARKEISQADIRLGDYWGSRFQHRSDGVSAAFACTEAGREALKQLLTQGKILSLEASDAAEMLAAQNMAGYRQRKLHDEAMEVLRTRGAKEAVSYYRKRQTGKQKLKRILLQASALIPSPLRAKLRKANSSRQLRKK